jgi:hypothetical protein
MLHLKPLEGGVQDGRNWARIEAEHHTHALFDRGEEGEWDALFAASPQVLAAAPKDMRLYYHSYDAAQERFRVGLATSQDGFRCAGEWRVAPLRCAAAAVGAVWDLDPVQRSHHMNQSDAQGCAWCRWEKAGPIFDGGPAGSFDCAGVGARCVVRDFDSRQFFMFYEGYGANGRRSIGVAVSKDGKSGWRRHSEPVLSAAEGDVWDSYEVGTPCAVSMAAGKWRLYYAGRGGDGVWGGIGVALSQEGDLFHGAPTKFARRTS